MQDLIERTLALAQELWPGVTETTRTFDWRDGQPVLTLMFARCAPGWTDSGISVYLYAERWVAVTADLWCVGAPLRVYIPYRRGDIEVPMSVVREVLQHIC